MQLGKVMANATATVKHPTMLGAKLLLVQPLLRDGTTPDADPQLCVDVVGAGVGQMVIISSDGRYAREVLRSENTPVRWTVIGIKD